MNDKRAVKRTAPPFVLVRALRRALLFGLSVARPTRDRRWAEVSCARCGATLSVPAVPRKAIRAVLRVNDFAARHHGHAPCDRREEG